MEQSDLLRFMATVMETMGLRYFVTGSTATIFFGEPRFTNDIDIVADLSESHLLEFCSHFPADEFYLSQDAALDAIRRKTQFNIIHPKSGLKVDVMVPELNLFNQSRFARTIRVHTEDGCDANFASPEDAMIKKMEYYRQGGSEKHLRDIIGILKTSHQRIDALYISKWVSQMDLDDIWALVQAQAARH